jgi:hypothetical protein
MAKTRVTIHLDKGGPHVLDFESEDEAKAALTEVQQAMRSGNNSEPQQLAGRLLIRPIDIRSAEIGEPPTYVA